MQCMQYTWCAAQVHDVKTAMQDFCTLTQMNVKAERDMERHWHLPLALLSNFLINFVRHMVCELCGFVCESTWVEDCFLFCQAWVSCVVARQQHAEARALARASRAWLAWAQEGSAAR